MRTGLETEFITPAQFIEKVGRTCYKSEDKITEDSAEKFVGNLIKRGHEAMIEHYSLIFRTDMDHYEQIVTDWNILMHNQDAMLTECLRPFLRFTDTFLDDGEIRHVVSGNMRAWRNYVKACIEGYGNAPEYLWGLIRNNPLFFSEFQAYVPAQFIDDIMIPMSVADLTDLERRVHMDVTMKFTCDRGVSHEIVRHRVASFAQESTRYCNYGQDKFGNEITVIRPSWCDEGSVQYHAWRDGCAMAEGAYFTLLSEGATPQEARSVLPNSLKTEVIVTMNLDGWNHFLELRCASTAQPDMREVAWMANELMVSEVYPEVDE
jgi:thymidylate synthase (FAD)